MAQPLLVLSNSGATGTGNGVTTYPGKGITKAVYRFPVTFQMASTHTAQTLVPLATIARPGIVRSISASWLEVNAANTTLATVDVLKRASGAAAAGTSLLATVGTLTNNATSQATQSIGTAFALAQNTGAAAVRPVLATSTATLTLAAGDQLVLTTVATSTQGTNLSVTVEVEYNLNDEVADPGLI